jgi:predicted  nucleic acid-binding Zn-ribbon protein
MVEPDNLEARVAALESRVRALADLVAASRQRVEASERDAAAARVLAGGADRDTTEFRHEIRDFRQATVSRFDALREDLVDLREDLVDLRTHVNNGFTTVDQSLTEILGRLDAAAAGQQEIVRLLHTVIGDQ